MTKIKCLRVVELVIHANLSTFKITVNMNLSKYGVNNCPKLINIIIFVFFDPDNIGIDTKIKSLLVLEPEIQRKVN